MIPTPNVDHIRHSPFKEHVYEPAEDTFALLDALEQDVDRFAKQVPNLIVEIGCGSGCVSVFIVNMLKKQFKINANVLCTDINPLALQATLETAKRNDCSDQISVIQMHTLNGLMQRCSGKVDVLLFNPPYVPTQEEEEQLAQQKRSIEGSWAGGSLGINLLEDLLPKVKTLLNPLKGCFYFVAIKQNQPENLVQRLQSFGLQAEICLSRRAGREHLFIIRACVM